MNVVESVTMVENNKKILPKIGEEIKFSKTMTVAEQAFFTGISGNLGSQYVDRIRADLIGFPNAVVFEMAALSLVSTCVSKLCGFEYKISRIDCKFHSAVSVGSTLEAQALVILAKIDEIELEVLIECEKEVICKGKVVVTPFMEA